MGRPTRNTTRDLRRGNRESLLRALAYRGPTSRQKMSDLTGLSTATVSTLIAGLLAEGVVVEAGALESDGGRPRILIEINPGHGHLIGVDVGETRIRLELFDLRLTGIAKAEYAVVRGEHDPERVAEDILRGVRTLITDAGIDSSRVLGVGIGVPGVVAEGGVVDAPTYGWARAPLGELLRARTPLPLHIDNGAKTLGLAELQFGAGQGSDHVIVALLGTGVGVAIINDGTLYRGISNSAGEWGHTIVERDGRRCRCGRRGCLEAYVGAGAILERYASLAPGALHQGVDEETALAALIADADAGSAPAVQVLAETADWLAIGLANLINLFNPERVLLACWAGRLLGTALLTEIRAATRRRTMASLYDDATISLGALGPDAVALGAATLVLESFLATASTAPRA
ncbi:ROK family protein [Actinocorallia longicatena]